MIEQLFSFTLQILDNDIDQHYDKSSQNIQSQNEIRFKTLDEKIEDLKKVSFREEKSKQSKHCTVAGTPSV